MAETATALILNLMPFTCAIRGSKFLNFVFFSICMLVKTMRVFAEMVTIK